MTIGYHFVSTYYFVPAVGSLEPAGVERDSDMKKLKWKVLSAAMWLGGILALVIASGAPNNI